jgi:hypothetical protein
MSDGSGMILQMAYASYNQSGCFWRKSQGFLLPELETPLAHFMGWGLMHSGSLYEQAILVPATKGSASLYWPTPSAGVFQDGEDPQKWQQRADSLKQKGINGNGAGTPLTVAAARWVPHGAPYLHPPQMTPDGQKLSKQIPRLNPRFVDWLMGLPHGYSAPECKDSQPLAMQSYLCKLRGLLEHFTTG